MSLRYIDTKLRRHLMGSAAVLIPTTPTIDASQREPPAYKTRPLFNPPGQGTDNAPGLARASAVKRRHSGRLFAIPDVVAHGVSLSDDGQPIITVFLRKENAASRAQIPATLKGIRVRVVVSGTFEAH
jgi:hypothetical protein